MSVASEKNELVAWKAWYRFRRYGSNPDGSYSLTERLQHAGVAALGRLFVRVCIDTCRWRVEGDTGYRHEMVQGRRQFIFVMWHNRVPAFYAWAARNAMRSPRFRMDSIISASKDGEFLARMIREGGGGEIRGSSSRDATRALRAGVIAAKQGAIIATVGDGPRGPRYALKPGPIMLAKATGVSIVPVTWACNRTFQLHRSWDQLMAPLPFSTIRMRFGEPLHVPEDADGREIVTLRRELESRLDTLTEWGDANTRIAWQLPRPRTGEVLKRRPKIELNERRV